MARSGIVLLLACIAWTACTFAPGAADVDPGVEPSVDAAVVVEPTDDAAVASDAGTILNCPSNYSTVPGLSSRYRVRNADTFRRLYDDCKNDQNGATHLVVIESRLEGDRIRELANGEYWTGGVQDPTATTLRGGWANVTGGTIDATLWESDQPSDDDETENGAEQASMWQVEGLNDKGLGESYIGVCECDGRPIDNTVEDWLP